MMHYGYFNKTQNDNHSNFPTPTFDGGRCPPPSEIFAKSDPPPSKNAEFDRFPLITPQPQEITKKSIMANRKSSAAKIWYGEKNCTVNFSNVGTARCSRTVSLRQWNTCYSSAVRFTRKMQCFGLEKMTVPCVRIGVNLYKASRPEPPHFLSDAIYFLPTMKLSSTV